MTTPAERASAILDFHFYVRQAEERREAISDAYAASVLADLAWQDELERLFGSRAGDVRYTEQGRTGPTLGPLYAEFLRANAAWHAAKDARS